MLATPLHEAQIARPTQTDGTHLYPGYLPGSHPDQRVSEGVWARTHAILASEASLADSSEACQTWEPSFWGCLGRHLYIFAYLGPSLLEVLHNPSEKT